MSDEIPASVRRTRAKKGTPTTPDVNPNLGRQWQPSPGRITSHDVAPGDMVRIHHGPGEGEWRDSPYNPGKQEGSTFDEGHVKQVHAYGVVLNSVHRQTLMRDQATGKTWTGGNPRGIGTVMIPHSDVGHIMPISGVGDRPTLGGWGE